MQAIVLKNSYSEIHFSPYGAAIMKWIVQDSKLGAIDIVLGLDTPQEYAFDHPSFGSIVGRCANRINKACFSLNDQLYSLEANVGIHHLHGGRHNFAFKKWDVKSESVTSCTFRYVSPHLEGNFPGKLNVEVTYSLEETNKLNIEILAKSDRDTIANLTNHVYFNMNGHDTKSILSHQFQINASHFTPTNTGSIPSGVIQSVKNTEMDLRIPRKLDQVDFSIAPFNETKGHDHNYVLTKSKNQLASVVISDESGLKLECFTNQPGLQLYLGNWLSGVKGKDNMTYEDHQGFCLEAQAYPDSINNQHFSNVILRQGETYRHETSYRVTKT